MKRKQTTTYTMYKREHMCLVGSLLLLVSLFAAYIYFVSASVVHVVIRQEVQREIVAISSEISELEANYIAMQHSVSEEMATQSGFVEVAEKIYIDRSPDTLVLSSYFEDGS